MTDSQQQAAALISALGASLGLKLEPDADGACGLRVDERLVLTLRRSDSGTALLVHTNVGELPAADAERALRRLLLANHGGCGHPGTLWSLADNVVVLSRELSLAETDAQILVTELSVFVDLAMAEQYALQAAEAAPEPGVRSLPLGMEAA